MYYRLINNSEVKGPFEFMPGTDLEEFATQLKTGQLYVQHEKQDF
jgi:hypothetical protein